MQTIESIRKKQDKTSYFFLIWAVVIFLFFLSFSKSKLIPYILPLFPALAVLIARFVAIRFYQNNQNDKPAYRLLLQNSFISTLIAATWISLVTFIALAYKLDTRDHSTAGYHLIFHLKKR